MIKALLLGLALLVGQPGVVVPEPSVVHVTAERGMTGNKGTGTCVGWADGEGMVTTANHVVAGCNTYAVEFPGGIKYPAMLVKVDRRADYAILTFKSEKAEPSTPLAPEDSEPGDVVTCAGYGFGNNYRENTGVVLNDTFDMQEWSMMSVSARPGDSGGPVFNDNGELAGTLWGSLGGKCHYTKASYLRAVINDLPISQALKDTVLEPVEYVIWEDPQW